MGARLPQLGGAGENVVGPHPAALGENLLTDHTEGRARQPWVGGVAASKAILRLATWAAGAWTVPKPFYGLRASQSHFTA